MPEYRVKGALFENLKSSGPAFTGFIEIDPTQFPVGPDGMAKIPISTWPKTSKAGANYLQISEDKKRAGPATLKAGGGSPFKPRTKPTPDDDMDDGSIPF